MSLLKNVKIVENALIIDKKDDLQEELINNNEVIEVLSVCNEHKGTLVHKVFLLKHAASGRTCPKLLDKMR